MHIYCVYIYVYTHTIYAVYIYYTVYIFICFEFSELRNSKIINTSNACIILNPPVMLILKRNTISSFILNIRNYPNGGIIPTHKTLQASEDPALAGGSY